MATIEDLDIQNFNELSTEEALELIRKMRLNRRVNESVSRKRKSTPAKSKAKPKSIISQKDALELLKLLEG